MLSITTTETIGQHRIVQASNAAFLGALVLHVSAGKKHGLVLLL